MNLLADDIVPLAPGATAALRVRYEDSEGFAIAGADVEFALAALDGETGVGGASLSATTVSTDDAGTARVEVLAGAEQVTFRIRVSAENAVPLRYTVNVSETGFTTVKVVPLYDGWRSGEAFTRINVRMYRAQTLRCQNLEIDQRPESAFPPRVLTTLDDSAHFNGITANEAYTVIAWAVAGDDGPALAYGCGALGAAQVLPGPQLRIGVAMADRPLQLPGPTLLQTSLDLAPVTTAIDLAGDQDPWELMRCASGPGQLLLDAIITELDAIGDLPAHQAIDAHRGQVAADGCRPALTTDGEPSLDAQLTAAIAAGGTWPTGPDLVQLVDTRTRSRRGLELQSRLTADGPHTAHHELVGIRVSGPAATVLLELTATARPVLLQSAIALQWSDHRLAIGDHAFSLRAGSASRAAFSAVALQPLGLHGRATTLGTAIVESVSSSEYVACGAVSALVCAAAELPVGCTTTACEMAAAQLDRSLNEGWARADGASLDFRLHGAAPVNDADGDLIVDSIGRDQDGAIVGRWEIEVTLADGTQVATEADFGQAESTEQ